MEQLNCKVVQDLTPLYVDGLVSDETSELIERHIGACGDCNALYSRMKSEIKVSFEQSPINKKILHYVYGVRLWYLLCPLAAFILGYYNLSFFLRLYEMAIGLFCMVCVYSQFFSGLSWGIDLEQYELQKKAEQRAKKQWGKFYTSPLLLCLPCVLVLAVIEIPKVLNFIAQATS